MRLKNSSGLTGPLLAAFISALVGACSTQVDDAAGNFPNAPKVVAVYAVDSRNVVLPDVLVYSADKDNHPDDVNKTSKPPPSYQSYRVEFDQPILGSTIANQPNRADSRAISNGLGAASFCTPIGTGSVNLVDVDDSNRVIQTSVCYDPSSALGSYPNVVVFPGKGSVASATAQPFTCQSFAYERNSGGLDILRPNHKYKLTLASTIVGQYNNKAITTPEVPFTTDDFSLMAVGYQDQNTGYYVWLDKPALGLEKDLAAVGAANYVQPPDNTPLFLVFSQGVADTSTITITRAGTSSPVGVDYWDVQGRVIAIAPNLNDFEYGKGLGSAWESGATYTVTIGAGTKGSDSGTTIGADKVYQIKIDAGTPHIRAVLPGNGTIANSVRTYSLASKNGFSGITLVASDPIDPTSLGGITVSAGGVSVTSTAQLMTVSAGGCGTADGCTDSFGGTYGSWIRVTFPSGFFLTPSTTYTIKATGVKVATGAANQNTVLPDFSSTFATASYRTTGIYKIDSGYYASGFGPADAPIDRGAGSITFTDPGTGVPFPVRLHPQLLRDGSFYVNFTNKPDPTTLTTSNITLTEITPDGTTTVVDPSKISITADSGRDISSSRSDIVKITDANYPLKYNTKYILTLKKGVVDTISGQTLEAEGCKSGDDCPVVHYFTTRTFSASIVPGDQITTDPAVLAASLVSGQFTVSFTEPVDATSANAAMASAKLYQQNPDGSINATPISVTCTTMKDGGTKALCTPASVSPNTVYVASLTALSSAPIKVQSQVTATNLDGTTTTYPADQTSGSFYGSPTATFATPCASN
jgi:hypothetical protein